MITAALVLAAAITVFAPADATIVLGEPHTLQIDGATTAYAIDQSVATVHYAGDVLTITGHRAGSTSVVALTAAGAQTLRVHVTARAFQTTTETTQITDQTDVEARYTSSAQQIHTSADVQFNDARRRTTVSATAVSSIGERQFGETPTQLRTFSIRSVTARREWTLFDSLVEATPLTLDSTVLRGLHLKQGSWMLHGGYTTNASLGNALLSSESELVAGALYERRLTPKLLITPALFYYAGKGAVASMLVDYEDGDRLHTRLEIGASRAPGAAAELTFNSTTNRVRAEFRYQPRDFAVAGTSSLQGVHGDVSWSTWRGTRFTADMYGSASRYDLAGLEQTNGNGRVSLRWAWSDHVALTGGVEGSHFAYARTNSVATLIVPIGLQFDTANGGASLTYRNTRSTAQRGPLGGFRGALRARRGGFYANAYYDYQPAAPTLELVFRERPELQSALDELGIRISSPEELAHLLRDNAALINLGFIEGVNVNLSPLRTQAGAEFGWRSDRAGQDQLRLHLSSQRLDRIGSLSEHRTATLAYSRALRQGTTVFASLTLHETRHDGKALRAESNFELGIRQHLGRAPRLFRTRGTIAGRVVDEESRGVAGVAVQIEGGPATRTDDDGRFVFTGIVRGNQTVSARVGEGMYFTTPSKVAVVPGDAVRFSVARMQSHLIGHVVDDGGRPLGGVSVAIQSGDRAARRVTSDAEGAFDAPVAPGTYTVAIETASLTAGYTASVTPQTVDITRARPAHVKLHVAVARTLSGQVAGDAAIEVSLEPLHRTARTDAEGRFVFRALAAGTYTLVIPSRKTRVSVEIPSAAGMVKVKIPAATLTGK